MTQRTAPLGGLDLSKPLSAMRDGTALRLDDWVCRSHGVEVRPGYAVATSGLDPVVSLLSYPGQLFTATDDTIYAGSSVALGECLSGDWSATLIANPGGTHLVAVNGADLAQRYDGVTWAEAEITGVNSRNLTSLCEHANRIWAVERNSLTIWHLGTDAIEGPAQPLYLDGQCKRGGHAVAVASFGSGDPRLAIVTDSGELVVYAITDPAAKDGIALKGVWRVPAPAGKRCFVQLGSGRLGLLTVDGLLSVPDVIATRDSARTARPNISTPVNAGITAASGVVDSLSNDILMIQDGASQWVLSDTGAWSRWTLPATCWAEHDDGLYFGTDDGRVCKVGGNTDAGAPIRSFAVDAPSRWGWDGVKKWSRVRLLYEAAHPYVPRVELLTNHRNVPADFAAANIDDAYWQWSDVAYARMPMPWMRETSAEIQPWRSVLGNGIAASLMMSLQTLTPITWTGYEMQFRRGHA